MTRPASWQRAVTGLVGIASAIVAMGCNAILGNEEGTLRPTSSVSVTTTSAGGAGGGTGSGAGGTVGTGGSRDGGVETDANVMPPGDAMTDGLGCNPTLPPTCAGPAQKVVMTCDPDSRTFVSTSCPGAKLCDASSGPNQGTCQDPATGCAGKMPGDKFCSGKDSVTCGPDLVTSTTDTCPFACIGAGQCAACTPEAKQCMGNGYQTCQANGTWSAATACPSACIGAGECGACTPTEKGCSGNGVQTCQPNGTWGTATPCPFVCTGSGVCSGECAPGSKQCSGNGVQTCGSNGTWGAAVPCQFVCTGVGMCTGVCTPGTKQCMGNGVQTCQSNGTWGTAVGCQYTCVGQGTCGGICIPGMTQCSGNGVRTCQPGGTLSGVVACPSTTPVCSNANGVCGQPPSCTPALGSCGSGETCCASTLVPGGTFNRANDDTAPATVSDFRMDNYEATVGRFRKFVAGYPGNKPAQNAGKNPNNPLDIGWDPSWNSNLPTDAAALRNFLNSCGGSNDSTWTDAVGANENRAINCVNWYLAQAFCIWDGGRIPTEAEWNYAAAGGNAQREYPWGSAAISGAYASFYDGNAGGCFGDGLGACEASKDVLPVGSKPMGKGRWGHSDLSGNVAEWVIDYFHGFTTPCNNCSDPMPGTLGHVIRGGSYVSADYACTTASRPYDSGYGGSYGMRCVRVP